LTTRLTAIDGRYPSVIGIFNINMFYGLPVGNPVADIRATLRAKHLPTTDEQYIRDELFFSCRAVEQD
jgi:hypothetical protein